MPRLRAVQPVAAAIGSFNPGQIFELDDEYIVDAWLAAGIVELAPEAPEPETAASSDDDGGDETGPSEADMRAASEEIEKLRGLLDDERTAHEATKAELEEARAETATTDEPQDQPAAGTPDTGEGAAAATDAAPEETRDVETPKPSKPAEPETATRPPVETATTRSGSRPPSGRTGPSKPVSGS